VHKVELPYLYRVCSALWTEVIHYVNSLQTGWRGIALRQQVSCRQDRGLLVSLPLRDEHRLHKEVNPLQHDCKSDCLHVVGQTPQTEPEQKPER
jgi:hypothetical protein